LPPHPVLSDAEDPTAAVRAWLSWRAAAAAAAAGRAAAAAAEAAEAAAAQMALAQAYAAYWQDQPPAAYLGYWPAGTLPPDLDGRPRRPWDTAAVEWCRATLAAQLDAARELHAARLAAKADRAAKAEAEKAAAEARRAAQLAAWVRDHGSPNQQARFKLGKLPDKEVIDAIRAGEFWPLDEFARYPRIQWADLRHAETCAFDCYPDPDRAPPLSCETTDADEMTAADMDLYGLIEGAAPAGAVLTVRDHTCTCDDCGAALTRRALLVRLTVGELALSREYALSEGAFSPAAD